MPLSILFWVLYVLAVIAGFGWISGFPTWANSTLLFILIGLIGWQVFGAAVKK
jgi:hypothetical protein